MAAALLLGARYSSKDAKRAKKGKRMIGSVRAVVRARVEIMWGCGSEGRFERSGAQRSNA